MHSHQCIASVSGRCAARPSMQVPKGDKAAAIHPFQPIETFEASTFESTASGLTVKPDLSSVGAAILALPDEFPSHPLDMIPKDLSDSCSLTVRQFIFLLQHCGFVGSDGTSDRCISYENAVGAIQRACFPKVDTSFMV